MLRTTAAGKVAVGPSNTSDGKTATNLNSQVELTAANAEIERLQELLKAREPLTPSEELSNTQRLTTVLKALAQRIALASSRSAKVADPPLLIDGTNPTFDNWKLQLQDKLEVNADHFPTT